MAIDQLSNMLTVAAALSMAGWVARSPEYLPEQPFNGDHEGIDYFGHQQQFWQNDNREVSSPLVQTMTVAYDINDNFHESKFNSEFSEPTELQDLVSWEEASRRGDLSFGSTTNYAYPLVTFEGNNEHLYSQLQEIPGRYQANGDYPFTSNYGNYNSDILLPEANQDDGYGSGDIGSPESSDMSSLLSLNLDDISSSSSPISNLLDLNDNVGVEDLLNSELGTEDQPGVNGVGVNDIQGAVGYSLSDPDFDIERLFSDDYYDLYDALPRTKDEPADTVRSRVNSREYASPLIDPHFDDYLGRFIAPDQQNNLDTSFDDPFSMQFTEQPLPDSKLVSEVLTEFDYLPYGATLDGDLPSPYEKDFEGDVGDEEVETLSGVQGPSQNNYVGPSAENVHSIKSNIPLPDHDYAKELKEEELMDPATRNAVDALASNFYKFHKDTLDEKDEKMHDTLPIPVTRTYAPTSQRTSAASKGNKQKIISPDLPYTSEELIEMDVDQFNKLISQFDDMRQLVLKDMRKKGKNKFAARNCRKRKLEVIDSLDNNIELLEKQKELLLHEQQLLLEETRQIHEKTVWLNNYILERLFDESGNSYSDSYTLEYTTDGNVYLVPYVLKTEGKVGQDV